MSQINLKVEISFDTLIECLEHKIDFNDIPTDDFEKNGGFTYSERLRFLADRIDNIKKNQMEREWRAFNDHVGEVKRDYEENF